MDYTMKLNLTQNFITIITVTLIVGMAYSFLSYIIGNTLIWQWDAIKEDSFIIHEGQIRGLWNVAQCLPQEQGFFQISLQNDKNNTIGAPYTYSEKDPYILISQAYKQITNIAKVRNMSPDIIASIVEKYKRQRVFDGVEIVNVNKLNYCLQYRNICEFDVVKDAN